MTLLRDEVRKLSAMGTLPAEMATSEEVVGEYEDLILAISRPVSDEEARALATLFGPDGCFGLAQALVRLIESAPGWPLSDVLASPSNEWLSELRARALRRRA